MMKTARLRPLTLEEVIDRGTPDKTFSMAFSRQQLSRFARIARHLKKRFPSALIDGLKPRWIFHAAACVVLDQLERGELTVDEFVEHIEPLNEKS